MIGWDVSWVNIGKSGVDGDGYGIPFKGDKMLLPTNDLGMFINLSVEPFQFTQGMNLTCF